MLGGEHQIKYFNFINNIRLDFVVSVNADVIPLFTVEGNLFHHQYPK